MKKQIAVWMYTNDNGYIPKEKLSSILGEMKFEVLSDFDMRECYAVNGNVYTKCGVNLSEFDLLFHMNADEETSFQLDILRSIEDSGVKVVNESESFFRCRDKYRANTILRDHGVRVPDSVFFGTSPTRRVINELFSEWGRLVYKPRTGHGASGIMLFDNPEEFWDFFGATKDYLGDYYLERFIEFGDIDYRVELLNGEVLGGYSRKKSHSFKTNISSGGKMLPREMSDEVDVALRAAEVLGINGTIIDMVQSLEDGEIYVLEVNPLLGIFVESAMKAETKMPYTEPDPEYCYDDKKIRAIANYIASSL